MQTEFAVNNSFFTVSFNLLKSLVKRVFDAVFLEGNEMDGFSIGRSFLNSSLSISGNGKKSLIINLISC